MKRRNDRIGLAALAICLFGWNLGVAQDLIITNARIVVGTGEVIDQGSIVIDDGRILSVTTNVPGTLAVTIIDAQGMTVLPGLIDTHVHLLLVDRTLEDQRALDQWVEQELPELLRAYLEMGFTTIQSVGDYLASSLEVRRRLATGELAGPRLLVSGPIFTATGGHPVSTACRGWDFCRDFFAIEVDDADTARTEVRELANAGVDAIKAAFESLPPGAPKLTDEVFAAIAEEARLQDLPLLVHAPGPEDAVRALELGASRLVHPPAKGNMEIETVTSRLRQAAVPFATTTHSLTHQAPNSPFAQPTQALLNQYLATIRALWDDGVVIAFGTDANVTTPAQWVSHEIQTLSPTLSPTEIISALTGNAAAFIDLGEEVGTLEQGKRADVTIVDGDPLADISELANVKVVLQDGRIVVDSR
jgi:imidazolonepropionase-like amidohydrolase